MKKDEDLLKKMLDRNLELRLKFFSNTDIVSFKKEKRKIIKLFINSKSRVIRKNLIRVIAIRNILLRFMIELPSLFSGFQSRYSKRRVSKR